MKKNKIIIFIVAMMMLVLVAGCGGKNATIATIDMEKIVETSPKVKQMQDEMQGKILQATEQLGKEQAGLSPEEFEKKKLSIDAELRSASNVMQDQLEKSIQEAVAEVSKEKNFGAVLHKQVAPYGGMDITEEVIKRMK